MASTAISSTATSAVMRSVKAAAHGAAVTAAAAQSLRLRSVYLKIHPVPKSFAARREVLRVIERFGTVEVFRSLKYNPLLPVTDAFVAVFETKDAAKEAINTSPISYRLIPASSPSPTSRPSPPTLPPSSTATTTSPIKPEETQNQSESQDSHSLDSSSTATSPPPQPPNPTSTSSSPQSQSQSQTQSQSQPEPEEYHLTITPTNHPHKQIIRNSPLYGPYTPTHPRTNALTAHLSHAIPLSIIPGSQSQSPSHRQHHQHQQSQAESPFNPGPARLGLLDWATDSLAARRIGAATLAVGGAEAGVPFRVRKMIRLRKEKAIAGVMRGVDSVEASSVEGREGGKKVSLNLWGLWERGKRAREREEEAKEMEKEKGGDGE